MTRNKHLSLSSPDARAGDVHGNAGIQSGRSWLPAGFREPGSQCRERVEKDLDVRVHRCPISGLELDREVNAARKIHQKAFKTLGSSVQDST